MSTTKLTKAQQKAMDDAMKMYEEAQVDFETWYMTSHWTNTYEDEYETFEEAVNDNLLWIAKRDQPNDVEGYIREHLEWTRGYYEKFRSGIVEIYTSSHTLRALERRGLIEIIEEGGRSTDTIRLLTV